MTDAGESQTGVKALPSGVVPEMVNGPQNCPTILVDGVNGITRSAYLTKIMLVEHIPNQDIVTGRFVATLVMQNDQFEKIVEMLNRAVAVPLPEIK
ncbi:MAG: hypothetical protein ABI673_07135 [Novosphingobium sp.]